MTKYRVIDGCGVAIGVHTVTRESQEVMPMLTTVSVVGFSDGDEDVETLMIDADIPFSGQLNITTSSLPDNPP